MIAANARIVRGLAIGWLVFISLRCSDHASTKSPESGLWITGKVQDLGGRPIKGAQAIVWLASADPNEARPRRVVATSDATGAFKLPVDLIPRLDTGEAALESPKIRFERAGYADALMQPKWPDAKNPTFDIGPVGMAAEARIVGIVDEQIQDPTLRCRLTATLEGSEDEVVSGTIDADGSFRIAGLRGGRHHIKAFKSDGGEILCVVIVDETEAPDNTISVVAGGETRARVQVGFDIPWDNSMIKPPKPTRRVIVNALDRDGKPLAGATLAVRLAKNALFRFKTDDQGTVAVDRHDDDLDLEVALIRGDQVMARKKFPASGASPFELRIDGEPTRPAVIVRLRDSATGAPIRNVTITAAILKDPYDGCEIIMQESPRPKSQETDPGVYRVPYFPYCLETFFCLGIRADGYGSVHTKMLDVSTCEDVGPIDLTMSPGGSLVARVVNACTGKPILGVDVELDDIESKFTLGALIGERKTTDANGCVRMDDVAVGNHRLHIWKNPQAQEYEDQLFSIERGRSAMIEARVNVRGKLRVDVVDRQGKPIKSVAVSVTRDGSQLKGSEQWLEAGGYLFMTFDAGPCHVEATGGTLGDDVLTGDAVIRAGEDTSLVLKVKS